MEANVTPRLVRDRNLSERIDLLAAVDASEAPFISSYLDMRSGKDNCYPFILEQAKHLRSGLSGVKRLDFEEAFDMVRNTLNHAWTSEVQGLAIFARGMAGGRFLYVIPFGLPFEQHLAFSRVPDIRALLRFRDETRPYTLLWARDGGIDISDIRLGTGTPMGWVANPLQYNRSESENNPGTDTRLFAIPCQSSDSSLPLLRRLLEQNKGTPLVLMGAAEQLGPLHDWLPEWVRSRLQETLPLPTNPSPKDAWLYVTHYLVAKHRYRCNCFAADLVDTYYHGKKVVAGTRETLGALQAGVVETLVITAGPSKPQFFDRFSPINRYIDWLTGDSFFLEPDLGWHPAIELCRIAYQRGIKVVIVDSDEISKIGGICGLLKGPMETQVMPLPEVNKALEMVA